MRRSKRDRGSLCLERLESRNLLHGSDVVVTDTHVIAGHDVVPRFAANADFVAIGSGDWSDPSVWNKNRVPGAGATVQIPHGKSISYDVSSRIELDAIEVSGRLDFDPTVNTALWLGELMVMPDGVLTVGTHDQPISPSVLAKIVFTDTADAFGRPINTGTVESPGIDPQQWGNGLLVFGHVEMVGQEKSSSYMRLKKEPLRGDTVLQLEQAPVGWRAGDILVLPDTNPNWNSSRVEELVIKSVVGTQVTLQSPLATDHRGVRNASGALQYLPHVGNLSRNILITSENPDGVRGHTAYFASADVHIEYVRFTDLGRTLNSELDSTRFAEDGSVVSIGTNQVGRYSVHLHHLVGPSNPSNTGYQFKLVGNAIDNGQRWGVALHGASYGLVSGNFIYDMVGAGLVTEDGTESYNTIVDNFIVKTTGRELFKEGRGGEAVWLRGPLNDVRNNVVANSNRAAFDYFSQGLPKLIERPQFRGASEEMDFELYDVRNTPIFNFADNEVYASDSAFDSWENQPGQRQYITRLVAWNTNDNNFVLSSYQGNNVVIDGLTIVGDFSGVSPVRSQQYQPIPESGVQAVRQSGNMTIRNSTISGVQTGIETPTLAVERMVVQNTTIQAYTGIRVGRMTKGSVTNTDVDREYGALTIENTRFLRMPENTLQPQQFSIYMDYDTSVDRGSNLLAKNEVFVLQYNGVASQNYQVYYLEQAPNFVVPQSVLVNNPRFDFTASPEPGLTNLQLWQKYGVAIAGAVAPTREVDGDNGQAALARGLALGIRGLVFPLKSLPAAPRANAGADFSAVQNQVVSLAGTVSAGAAGDWSKFSGPGDVVFDDFQRGNSLVSFSEPGTYTLRFTAQIGARRAFDDVVVRVTPPTGPYNHAPRVNAGEDRSILSNVTQMSGSATDDGLPFNNLTYTWSLVSGPGDVVFSNSHALDTNVSFPAKGEYILELRASDGGRQATDQVVVTVERVVPQTPMLAHWKMDSIVADSTADVSVHQLHAKATDVRIVTGKMGSAIDLRGGYLVVPSTELMMPADAVTIAGWVRPTAGTTSQPVFSWDGGSWDAFKLSLANRDNRTVLSYEVTTNVGVSRFTSVAGDSSVNKWTHLALTFSNAAGGEVRIYRDGVLIARQTNLGQELSYKPFGTRQFFIGRDTNAGVTSTFNGAVDDFYAFNFALSLAEIRALMTGVEPIGATTQSGFLRSSSSSTSSFTSSLVGSSLNVGHSAQSASAELQSLAAVFQSLTSTSHVGMTLSKSATSSKPDSVSNGEYLEAVDDAVASMGTDEDDQLAEDLSDLLGVDLLK